MIIINYLYQVVFFYKNRKNQRLNLSTQYNRYLLQNYATTRCYFSWQSERRGVYKCVCVWREHIHKHNPSRKRQCKKHEERVKTQDIMPWNFGATPPLSSVNLLSRMSKVEQDESASLLRFTVPERRLRFAIVASGVSTIPAGSACVSIGDKFSTKVYINSNTILVPMVLGFRISARKSGRGWIDP